MHGARVTKFCSSCKNSYQAALDRWQDCVRLCVCVIRLLTRRLFLVLSRSFSTLCIHPFMFHTMTFPNTHSLGDVNSRNHSVAFGLAPWFHSQFILDDDIIIRYVCGDHPFDGISLFALSCDDFRLHMCAVNIELKSPKFGHIWARKRFVHFRGSVEGHLVVAYHYRRSLALTFCSLDRMMSILLVDGWRQR